MKFEYKVIELTTYYKLNQVLNEYGDQGWELVQLMDLPTKLRLIFKRIKIAE